MNFSGVPENVQQTEAHVISSFFPHHSCYTNFNSTLSPGALEELLPLVLLTESHQDKTFMKPEPKHFHGWNGGTWNIWVIPCCSTDLPHNIGQCTGGLIQSPLNQWRSYYWLSIVFASGTQSASLSVPCS